MTAELITVASRGVQGRVGPGYLYGEGAPTTITVAAAVTAAGLSSGIATHLANAASSSWRYVDTLDQQRVYERTGGAWVDTGLFNGSEAAEAYAAQTLAYRNAAEAAAVGYAIVRDTKAEIDADTTALVAQVTDDGDNNGFYVRTDPDDPETAWEKRSDNTFPGLDTKFPVASNQSLMQVQDADDGVAMEVTRSAHIAAAEPGGRIHRLARPSLISPMDATGWQEYLGTRETYPGVINYASLHHLRKHYLNTVFACPVFGQSLAGGAQDNLADVAISTSSTYAEALMPFVGRKPEGVYFDSFVPSREWTGTASSSTTESINTAMLNRIIADLFAAVGVKPTVATAAFSRGSRTWPQLGPGNDAWLHFTKGLRCMQMAAENLGRDLQVPAIVVLWGEQNRSIGLQAERIRDHYLNMGRHMVAAVREITHQPMDPIIFLSIPANSNDAANTDRPHATVPGLLHGVGPFRVIGPNYIFPVGGNVHPTAAAYNEFGNRIGRAIVSECFGPGHHVTRARPEMAYWRDATTLRLPISVPVPPIVVDTSESVVALPDHGTGLYGFRAYTRDATELTISSIAASAGSGLAGDPSINLDFTFSSSVSGSGAVRLGYALTNGGGVDDDVSGGGTATANAGPTSGARGCIHDSDPDYPNWLLPFWAQIPAY